MLRRRRTGSSEIAFSFDSFLDLVANVVGVILRLILVAWVGARTYTGIFVPPTTTDEQEATEPATATVTAEPPLSTDAEKQALEQARQQLAAVRATLLEHLRAQDDLKHRKQSLDLQLTSARRQTGAIQERVVGIDGQRRKIEAEHARVELSLAEIRNRADDLRKDLAKLEKQPVTRHVLRYQTPVARTVQSEEMQFEIKDGRVTFIDVEAMVREIKEGMRARAEQLRRQWDVRDETVPVGAFRLRYVITRERGLLDAASGGQSPVEKDNFRYGVGGWEAIPVQTVRGETAERALTEQSEFRKLIDHLDATQTAVTFWVYPDSFPAYRQLRDYCVKRDLLVAGRPLPEGVPIASSRTGSASRGQ